MPKTGMVTGTFDPVTIGHLDIIGRAAKVFDKLFVVILENPDKCAAISKEKRLEMLKRCLKDIPNAEAFVYDGWAIDFAQANGVDFFVRGVRNSCDFEYELAMRDWNFAHGGIDTLLLMSGEEFRDVSSTVARESAKAGNLDFVPDEIKNEVKQCFEVDNG